LNSDPEGEGGESWLASLPEELQISPDLQDIKSVEALAENFIERGKHVGASIRIPSEDASKEDWSKFHSRLVERVPNLMPTPDFTDKDSVNDIMTRMGKPEAAGKYKDPEGMELPNGADLRELAFNLNLTQSQYEGLVKGTFDKMNSDNEVSALQQTENLMNLKKDWGLAFDEKIGRVGALLEIMEAPEPLKNAFKENAMDTALVKWLDDISAAIGTEGGNLFNEETEVMTPLDAQTRLDEIMSNMDHPYWDQGKTGHKAAVMEVEELTAASIAGGVDHR